MEAGFLAAWTPTPGRNPAALAALDAALGRWGTATPLPAPAGLRLVVFGASPPRVRRLGEEDVVVGDLFDGPPSFVCAIERLRADPGDAVARARGLLTRFWGGYVALLRDRTDWTVLRDPSGAHEAFVWSRDGLGFASSTLRLPPGPWSPRLRPDWERIGRLVADPCAISGPLALGGAVGAAPGELRGLDGAGRQLWTPAMAAGRGVDEGEPRERLYAAVAGCVAAWGSQARAPIVEVSGGLDSAIVTAALGPQTRSRAVAFVNHVVNEPGADERGYARRVAERWGVELVERPKPEGALDLDALAATADAARPSLNGGDEEYDRGVAQMCADLGADAVVTGQGGDAVFLNLRSSWLAADRVRRRGLASLGDPELRVLAEWTQSSLWTVWRRGLLGLARCARPPRRTFNRFASPTAQERRGPLHPWLQDLGRFAPGRRLQIEAFADTLVFHGDCLRTRGARLVHPLLSQPILEVCLTLPPDVLVRGGRDRSLAREAFASRLPQEIFDRRSKGDLTAYYGRMIWRGLGALRPFLLDGVLAAHHLVDVDALAAALTPERLAADDAYADIMDLAAIEAWARHWTQAAAD